MKIHDFGLWFMEWVPLGGLGKWSNTIPLTDEFFIYYDSQRLGWQDRSFRLINEFTSTSAYTIKLKQEFPVFKDELEMHNYLIGRKLTLDDFEIVKNPRLPGV
jgi:hypothetical protein